MYNIRIGQVIYGYSNKYELYYKLSKNFYLKYQKHFKNLQVSNSNNNQAQNQNQKPNPQTKKPIITYRFN